MTYKRINKKKLNMIKEKNKIAFEKMTHLNIFFCSLKLFIIAKSTNVLNKGNFFVWKEKLDIYFRYAKKKDIHTKNSSVIIALIYNSELTFLNRETLNFC